MAWRELSRDGKHIDLRCTRCGKRGCVPTKMLAAQMGDRSLANLSPCCCERAK